ncbi:MAG: AzlC family ABC transporter permease [Clostridiales bacterium]|nr:AzlC family ABC transporter permease [Roseburia sp.]MDD7635406.1 AzlC family ABC transporter permease [Clostridiales bacterium]MDY4113162.1 AzlC family ABC transporter permease [Roseburia sp.]
MKLVSQEKRWAYGKAFRAAFPHTIPVLTGYLFIGMAFGVMIQEKGYNFLWAMFMSLLCYAGSGQYLAVNFFSPGVSLFHVIFMEFMVNIRHIFYGLSLLERFAEAGKKRLYLIFSLTDETYSLYFITKVPPDVEEDKFLFAIAVLDQSYWIIGSGIGALLGNIIPFDATGIDFAMTALFVVIMVEQWMEKKNRPSVVIGLVCGLACLLIFGKENFILPTMIGIMLILLFGRRALENAGGVVPQTEPVQGQEVQRHAD